MQTVATFASIRTNATRAAAAVALLAAAMSANAATIPTTPNNVYVSPTGSDTAAGQRSAAVSPPTPLRPTSTARRAAQPSTSALTSSKRRQIGLQPSACPGMRVLRTPRTKRESASR
jgi:hypothetical protein